MPYMKTTRRRFLRTTGTVGAAAVGFPTIIPSSALGNDGKPAPSNRIVMGGIGIGNMGRGDHRGFLNHSDVQYVAVCDVRKGALNGARDATNKKYNNQDCKAYGDYRELLARDDIDAVHIATPDHWHAIQIIDACRAGKDVFCQKPETRCLAEGPVIIAAAERYGRVISGGSQRVLQDYMSTVKRCWEGHFGKVSGININVGPLSQPCNLPIEKVPDDIDWDMWLGPAPWAPYNSKRCSGSYSTNGNSWRSYLDYSGGGMTDWGAHHFGGATFAVDVRDLQPDEVVLNEDGGKKWVAFKYPNGITITHNRPDAGGNMRVDGTKEKIDPKPYPIPSYKGKGGIGGDFIEAVKTRGKPFRQIEHCVNTMVLPHLATIAYTVNRSLKWDSKNQVIVGDPEANRYVDTARREPWQL